LFEKKYFIKGSRDASTQWSPAEGSRKEMIEGNNLKTSSLKADSGLDRYSSPALKSVLMNSSLDSENGIVDSKSNSKGEEKPKANLRKSNSENQTKG